MESLKRFGRWLYDRPYLLLVITMMCWAGNAIVGRGIRDEVPPAALAYIRWSGAFLITLPFAWPHLRRDWPIIRANLPIILLLSLLGVTCFNTMLYTGLQYTVAINGALLQSANPVVIALAVFLLYRERPGMLRALGIAVSLCGVLLIVSRADMSVLRQLSFNTGDVWIIAAVGIWGLYTALLRRRPPLHWLTFLNVTFGLGVAMLTPVLMLEIANGHYIRFGMPALAAGLYVILFPSMIAYLAYTRGVELAGATIAGAFHHLIPIFTAILGFVFLNEVPQLYHAAGFALVIGGVALASRKAN